jgi:hypothetical protein
MSQRIPKSQLRIRWLKLWAISSMLAWKAPIFKERKAKANTCSRLARLSLQDVQQLVGQDLHSFRFSRLYIDLMHITEKGSWPLKLQGKRTCWHMLSYSELL